jgi:hypothetical protein
VLSASVNVTNSRPVVRNGLQHDLLRTTARIRREDHLLTSFDVMEGTKQRAAAADSLYALLRAPAAGRRYASRTPGKPPQHTATASRRRFSGLRVSRRIEAGVAQQQIGKCGRAFDIFIVKNSL